MFLVVNVTVRVLLVSILMFMEDKMHPAVQHIKRLQREKHELIQALFLERKYREKMKRMYVRRLMSRFMWLIDLMSYNWRDAV